MHSRHRANCTAGQAAFAAVTQWQCSQVKGYYKRGLFLITVTLGQSACSEGLPGIAAPVFKYYESVSRPDSGVSKQPQLNKDNRKLWSGANHTTHRNMTSGHWLQVP